MEIFPPWWFTRARDQDRLNKMGESLEAWTIPPDALDTVHTEGKDSMATIQALTEYEDGKVARLLTIVAFLSAIAGVVFSRFATDYAWVSPTTKPWLPTATYIAFLSYVVSVSCAVLLLLSAIRPTFNAPKLWLGRESQRPRSLFFYIGVLAVTAPNWAQTFKDLAGEKGTELKAFAAKNYVLEAYLIAEKVAHKLWWVRRGVGLLQFAMAVLVVFFTLYAGTVMTVAPTRPTPATTVKPVARPPASQQPRAPKAQAT